MGELVILHISFQTKCFLALVTFIWAFCTAVFRYEIASIFLCQIELKLNFQQSLKIMQGVLKCICKGGPYLPTFPFTVEWKTNK